MVAITELAKIQLRSGLSSDLPGAPTSLNPITFSPGLDVGEMALCYDNGRIFIGQAAYVGSPNYNRVAFPYQNIEVLTEASPTLKVISDKAQKENNTGFYNSTLISASNWTDLITTTNGTSSLYVFNGATVQAMIDYFAFDSLKNPVRMGTLRIFTIASSTTAKVQDDAQSERNSTFTLDETVDYDTIRFNVVQTGSGNTLGYKIQYMNLTGSPINLYFSVKRPLP